jgi:hypothetical protein
VLERTQRGYRFPQALVEEGISSTTNEDERLAIHRVALAHFGGKPLTDARTADTVARHADAIGDAAIAASAYAALGELAEREHRALDADQAWTGATRHLAPTDSTRGRALLGRARARYRLQRVRDALVDLDAAIALARDLGDVDLEL